MTSEPVPSPPPSARRHLRALAPIFVAAMVLAVGLYGLYWRAAAGQVEAGIEGWAETQRADGTVVIFTSLAVDGFPFNLRAQVIAPTISRPDASTPWRWAAERLILSAKPWDLARIDFDLSGTQMLTLGADGSKRQAKLAAQYLRGAIHHGARGFDKVTLDARKVQVTVDGSGNSNVEELIIVVSGIPTLPAPETGPSFRIAAKTLSVDQLVRMPLEGPISSATAKGRLLGPVIPGPWPNMLTLWRDGGGTIDFQRIGLNYGPLNVEGDGTMALDALRQPLAAFTLKVRGAQETVDQMAKARRIKPAAALGVNLALVGLSQSSGDGSFVQVPLTLQDRKLSLGPFEIATLPRVAW